MPKSAHHCLFSKSAPVFSKRELEEKRLRELEEQRLREEEEAKRLEAERERLEQEQKQRFVRQGYDSNI